jgi:hypothetical protein
MDPASQAGATLGRRGPASGGARRRYGDVLDPSGLAAADWPPFSLCRFCRDRLTLVIGCAGVRVVR